MGWMEKKETMTQEHEERKAVLVKAFERDMWNFLATALDPQQLIMMEQIEKEPVSGIARAFHKKRKSK
jgi:hypothetical protein